MSSALGCIFGFSGFRLVRNVVRLMLGVWKSIDFWCMLLLS